MVTFILIRHGYSQFNKEKKYTGHMDVPLEELGVCQAAKTAEYIQKNYKVDKIYSSDLSRAMNTVKPLAKALGLPVHPQKDLREIYLGSWEGQLIEEVQKREEFRLWNENSADYQGDAETRGAFWERCVNAVQRIALENEGKCVLLSTHGGVVNGLMRIWLEDDKTKTFKATANSSVSVVQYDAQTQKARIQLMGYTEHLQ